jgi:hypothetical protein
MANPSVITRNDLLWFDNKRATFSGQVIRNGWEIISVGFYYYSESEGIENQHYISGNPIEDDVYDKTLTTLSPNTNYYYRARTYWYRYNEETEEGENYEAFGAWYDFTTDAYARTDIAYACDINKENGNVTFWGDVSSTDGAIAEVGFEYGTSKSGGNRVTLEGNYPEGFFSIEVQLSPNQNYYVRSYIKTVSGHEFFSGDGYDIGWQAFTTKKYRSDIAVLYGSGYDTGFIMVLDKTNGIINNTWKMPESQNGFVGKPIAVAPTGIAYYGFGGQSATNWIGKVNIRTGEFFDAIPSVKCIMGIAIGINNIFTMETSPTNFVSGVIYKRDMELQIIEQVAVANSTWLCSANIGVDSQNIVYIPLTNPGVDVTYHFESYGLFGEYNINGVKAGIEEIVCDYSGTLWQWDYANYEQAINAPNASYVEDDYKFVYAGAGLWSGDYNIMRLALFFNTSGIMNPLEAKLVLYCPYEHSGDSEFVIQNGMPEYPHNPLISSDYDKSKYSGNGGFITTSGWEGYTSKEFDLDKNLLNPTGYTKLLIRDIQDIDGIPPTEWTELQIAGHLWDEEEIEYRPKLRIKIDDNYFSIGGNYANVFPEGASVQISNSTGNDGIYTVSEGGAYYSKGNTIIPITEKIPSEEIDGKIERVGNGERLNSVKTPISTTYCGVAVRGETVYMGAWFDFPIKANKDLSNMAIWEPSGSWESDNFWEVGQTQELILVTGSNGNVSYYAMGAYDENDNMIWQTFFIGNPASFGGIVFPIADLDTIKAEMRRSSARIRLHGEIL